ncbi:hypothetical protein MMC20_004295 [Loxospora ochrophaea]|nr:hypothetical protein [Loxospora ochrophaea]
MLQKSLSLPTDNITYDLEDSVAPAQKVSARTDLLAFLSSIPPNNPPTTTATTSSSGGSFGRAAQNRPELAIRINAQPEALDDLCALLPSLPPNLISTLVLPKVDSASDLLTITQAIAHYTPHVTTSPPFKILALIESAKALTNIDSICTAAPPGALDGLIFAAEDFARDMGITRTRGLSEFLYARSKVVTAVRAYELSSAIDLVCTEYKGEEGQRALEEECKGGKGLGFNGKQCIHPSQVEMVKRAFGPGEEEVEWAMKVVVGDEKAQKEGRGAWSLEGKMIDRPVVRKAEGVVEWAGRCGVDVEKVRERWRGLEPG